MKTVCTLFVMQFICCLAIGQSYTITPDSVSYQRNSSNGLNSFHIENGSSEVKRLLFTDLFIESNRSSFLQINGGGSHSGLLFKSKKHLPNQAAMVGFDDFSKKIIISHNFSISGTPTSSTLSLSAGIVVDSVGRVGIGTFSPKNKLHITNGGTSGVTPNSSSDIVLDRNNSSYINLLVPDNEESGIFFGTPTGGATSGGIIYNAGRSLNFRTSTNDTRIVITEVGNVAIGDFTPTTKLHVDGDFAIKKRTFLPVATQTINNLNRAGASIISSSASSTTYTTTISGIAAGVDGLILYINPVQNATIILQHESAGSISTSRIISHTTSNISIVNNGGATLMYDAIVDRWRVISVAN